jgi:hypothetical protein
MGSWRRQSFVKTNVSKKLCYDNYNIGLIYKTTLRFSILNRLLIIFILPLFNGSLTERLVV